MKSISLILPAYAIYLNL